MTGHRARVAAEGVPVLAARLAVPPSPEGFVNRPRLVRLLDAGTDGPVTLVAAPAGWGKTVLLSSWTRTADRPVAWLSIEPGDDRHFWAYLNASLAAVADPHRNGRPVLPAPPSEPDDTFLAFLADALMQLPVPLVLVLDNFHHLHDPGVLHGVDFLVRHSAARLRLVIGIRVEPALPLHRWRLTGGLTELRAPELSFTATETVELMAHHGLSLPDTRAAELAHHTEGWPAGLRLAALSMRRHPDLAVAGEFTGDDQHVVDYLAWEVLAEQPADVRDVIVSTSILEWVCGGLADALTGRTDGERIMSELSHGNTFVIMRETHPPTYRYHRLFREFLRGELRRRAHRGSRELHRRAAGWLATNGLPAAALSHALAAEDWGYATRLFVTHWRELVCQGHRRASGSLAPAPPAQALGDDPELALAYAAECLQLRELDVADGYLGLADRHQWLLVGGRRDRFALMGAALRQARAQLGGDPSGVLEAAADLLARACTRGADLPSLDVGAQAIAFGTLGSAQLDVGELDLAAVSLAGGLAGAARAGLGCLAASCASRLALVRALRGQLVSAAQAARVAFDLPPCPGELPAVHCAPAYLACAIVDIHRDRLADAEPNLQTAATLCDPSVEPGLAATVTAVRAQLCHQLGDLDAAYAALLAGRRELTERQLSPRVRQRLAVTEADVRTAHGDTGAVRELLEPLLPGAGPGEVDIRVALARAYLRDDDPSGAVEALPAWEDGRAAATPLAVRIDAGLLDAFAAQRRGDQRRSAWALERVLQLAEPEGFRRLFTGAGPATRDLLVGHMDSGTAYWSLLNDLVAAVGASGARVVPSPPSLREALTDRELTVLRYLQSILSTGEIASELYLSVNTVKTHLRNIYRKLDTTRRREAVRRGRELHLL